MRHHPWIHLCEWEDITPPFEITTGGPGNCRLVALIPQPEWTESNRAFAREREVDRDGKVKRMTMYGRSGTL